MYGSPAMSKDLNLPFPATPFKQGNEVVDLRQGHQQQQQMGSSGLLRYRAAPSNVLGDVCDEGVGAESMFARFMSPDLRDHLRGEKRSSGSPSEGVPSSPSQTTRFPSSGPPHMFFHAPLHQQPRQLHNPNLSSAASGGVESGGSSNIVRHDSTSPPGLFCHLNAENGFAGFRNMGGFRSPGGSGDNTEVGTSSSRLKGQISFNSRQGSLMSQVSDIGSDGLGGSSSEEGSGGGGCSGRCYIPGYPVASWDDSVLLSDSFSGGGKRIRDHSQVQNGNSRSHEPTLTHHFSSPRASAEATAMERFLQFQDAVPCKIRAKRGCATHPRSIAERVRRTRISERMRKLQELVPNMEKQTNTADMLDLAVDYIKELQRQAKMLTENREKCTCSSKPIHP